MMRKTFPGTIDARIEQLEKEKQRLEEAKQHIKETDFRCKHKQRMIANEIYRTNQMICKLYHMKEQG